MRDFLRAIGISNDEGFDFNVSDINVTPRPQEMKIRALLGAFEPTTRTSDAYLNVLSRLYAVTGKRPVDDYNFMVDPGILQEIQLEFQSSNERMCQQWFPGLDPSKVLERRNLPAPRPFSYDNVDLESMIAVLGGISIVALNRIEALEQDVKALQRVGGRARGKPGRLSRWLGLIEDALGKRKQDVTKRKWPGRRVPRRKIRNSRDL